MKKYIEAGLFIRRPIRRLLLRLGIDFKEEKGLLDSVFHFDCSDETCNEITRILTTWNISSETNEE